MSGLQEIAQAFGAISHSGEFYANINERIARVMGIAMCGILLYDEANNRLVAQKPFYGLDDSMVEHYGIDLTPGSAIEQIWQRRRLLVHQQRRDRQSDLRRGLGRTRRDGGRREDAAGGDGVGRAAAGRGAGLQQAATARISPTTTRACC